MSVVGVFTETDICHHKQVRHGIFDRSDRELNDTVIGISLSAEWVFRGGYAEQNCAGDAEGSEFFRGGDERVNRVLVASGHRRNFGCGAMSMNDEHRINEVVDRECGFADESAQVFICPQSSRPIDREGAHSSSEGEPLIS